MQSYRYDNHTVLIFGKGKHKEAGIEIKKYGKRALIVFYGEPYERKLIDEIEESLEENDVDYWEFTGVKPNPEMAPVLLAIELVKEKKIDFILAVGGGSVMDTAKTIGAGAVHQDDIVKLWTGEEKSERDSSGWCCCHVPGNGK